MAKEIKPTKTVYAYYFPEIRNIITNTTENYPHDVFLKSVEPGLDDFHLKAIDKYVEHVKEQMPGLENFPYRYTANGSSECIFHVLSNIAAIRSATPLYVFDGEYEGYAGYGMNLGLNFKSVSYDADFSKLEKGIFFVSNPSARNGNIIPNEKITEIGNAGHEIILDATYVGLTLPAIFLVNHPAISTVIVSLSKPYGLYYYRIGFCFMRNELKTLMVNKWFKNILNHIIAENIFDGIKASELVIKYRNWQDKAVRLVSEQFEIPIKNSEVLILAHIEVGEVPESKKLALTEFKRGPFYRFCLTPYFLEFEKENLKIL